MGGSETDPDLAPNEVDWHRVVGLADTDPRFVIDTAHKIDRHIERFNCQRLEQRLFQSEMLTDRDPATINRRATRNDTGIVCDIGGGNQGVEFVE